MKKQRRALIFTILTVMGIISIGLTACSAGHSSDTNLQRPEAPSYSSENSAQPSTQVPVVPPLESNGDEDEGSPYKIFSYDLPKGYKKPHALSGDIHEEHYTTYLYDNNGARGEEISATMYVYTPNGYDPEKQYNIVYLMHGIGDDEGYWLGVGSYAEGGEKYSKATVKYTTSVFDNMIADGLCDDAILVTPTFMDQFKGDDPYAAGSTAKLVRFSYQFKNDILPYIESKYSTYAQGDVSEESLIATRDHRAYAGLSMGSMTGFHAIWMNCIEYVSYLGNFSGCDPQETGIAEQVALTLKDKYADYDINYWYNGNGTIDTVHDDHVAGYATMLEMCPEKFTEGEDYNSGQNTIFVDKPGKGHAYNNWIVDFYNVMNIFFKVS